MTLKYPLIIALFFLLALVQASFLPHTSFMGVFPNLVFIAFFISVFFEKPNTYFGGFILACGGGLVLDLLSPFAFGYSIISMVIVYSAIKVLMYFLKESHEKYALLYFVPMFLLSLALYNTLMYVCLNFGHISFAFHTTILVALAYNLVVAFVVFCLYAYLRRRFMGHRQLTLFH